MILLNRNFFIFWIILFSFLDNLGTGALNFVLISTLIFLNYMLFIDSKTNFSIIFLILINLEALYAGLKHLYILNFILKFYYTTLDSRRFQPILSFFLLTYKSTLFLTEDKTSPIYVI